MKRRTRKRRRAVLPLRKYWRREPTTDGMTLGMIERGQMRLYHFMRDVVVYDDPQCRRFYVRIPWHHQHKPTLRTRYFTLNCYNWLMVHRPDLEARGKHGH